MENRGRFVLTVANATCNDLRILVCTTEVKLRQNNSLHDSREDTPLHRYDSNNRGVFDETVADSNASDVGQQIVPPASTGQFFSTTKGIIYLTIHEMGTKEGGYYVIADNTQWISDGCAIVANRRLLSTKSNEDYWIDENGQDWIVEQTPRWLRLTDEGILQTVLEHLKFFKNPKGKRKLLQRLTGNENLAFLQNHSVLKWITNEALDNLNKNCDGYEEDEEATLMKKLEIKLEEMDRKLMEDIRTLKNQKARMERWIKSLSDKFKNYDARAKQVAFINASKKGCLEEILALLEVGVFVNGIDRFGATALHWASLYGHLEIIQVLLDTNIDKEAKLVKNLEIENCNKIVCSASTALHVSATCGHACIVKTLIDSAVDVNVIDSCGRLALHLAAFEGHRDCVQILLKHTDDPDFKDTNYGSTPLHLASWKGHLSTVETLVKAGANVTASDFTGWTPLRWATSGGYNTIEKVLTNYGATK